MKVCKILLMNYKCLAFQLTSVYFIKKSFLLDFLILQDKSVFDTLFNTNCDQFQGKTGEWSEDWTHDLYVWCTAVPSK